MHVFYTPEIELPEFRMNESESNHAVRVLRLTAGAEVQLIDGKGGLYRASIIEASKKECLLRVEETIKAGSRPSFHFHLVMAPTKNMDRLQFAIEKAVEIGVSKITPILTEHSERKILNMDKVRKTVISAAKQSVSCLIPEIEQLTSLDAFIASRPKGALFMAHCAEDAEKRPLKDVYQKNSDVTICIGPEGDFSNAEIALALDHGFKTISLSANRLRTETAALVACHTVNLINS